MAALLIFAAAACGDSDGDETSQSSNAASVTDTADSPDAPKSPLSDKEYDKLKKKKESEFTELIIDLVQRHTDAVNKYNDFYDKNSLAISQGHPIKSMSDYEDTFDGWYEWIYQVQNYDSDNVPDDYRSLWQHFVNVADYEKTALNKVYDADQDTLVEEMNFVFAYSADEFSQISTEMNTILANAKQD